MEQWKKILKTILWFLGILFLLLMLYLGYLMTDFEFLFKVPEWIYIMILACLTILICKSPKVKVRVVTIIVSALLTAGILWIFGTHSPTEKVYSNDKQYSFYKERYNFNILYDYIPLLSPFHTGKEDKYKLFLYDEIEQKLLASQYLGEIYWQDKYGFPLYNNMRFYWGDGSYYKLPRPVIQESLSQKNERIDSINRARREEKMPPLIHYPKIGENVVLIYEPIISKWLDFLDVRLSDAHLISSQDISVKADDKVEQNYTDDDKNYPNIIFSPDKRRFIGMVYPVGDVNGIHSRYTDKGFYWLYLHDIEQSYYQMLLRSRFDAVYWINDDVFITVGERDDVWSLLRVCVFDLKTQTMDDYGIKKNENRSYIPGEYHQVFLRENGISPLTEFRGKE